MTQDLKPHLSLDSGQFPPETLFLVIFCNKSLQNPVDMNQHQIILKPDLRNIIFLSLKPELTQIPSLLLLWQLLVSLNFALLLNYDPPYPKNIPEMQNTAPECCPRAAQTLSAADFSDRKQEHRQTKPKT